jgi:hypothetical protein
LDASGGSPTSQGSGPRAQSCLGRHSSRFAWSETPDKEKAAPRCVSRAASWHALRKINSAGGRWVPDQAFRATAHDKRPSRHSASLVGWAYACGPGVEENPLDTAAVSAKTRDLIATVLGKDKADRLIDQIAVLEKLDDMRRIRRLFTV